MLWHIIAHNQYYNDKISPMSTDTTDPDIRGFCVDPSYNTGSCFGCNHTLYITIPTMSTCRGRASRNAHKPWGSHIAWLPRCSGEAIRDITGSAPGKGDVWHRTVKHSTRLTPCHTEEEPPTLLLCGPRERVRGSEGPHGSTTLSLQRWPGRSRGDANCPLGTPALMAGANPQFTMTPLQFAPTEKLGNNRWL